jgi:hypothetical protein
MVKECTNTLRPLEDELEKKIEAHNERLWNAFDKRNRALIDKLEDHKQEGSPSCQNQQVQSRVEPCGDTGSLASWIRERRNRLYSAEEHPDDTGKDV